MGHSQRLGYGQVRLPDGEKGHQFESKTQTRYSAFNLEEPLLCFVVNKYVLYSEKVTIVAIGLKFAMSVHTSFRSVCRKSGLIMLVDSKVVAACVPGIGLQL